MKQIVSTITMNICLSILCGLVWVNGYAQVGRSGFNAAYRSDNLDGLDKIPEWLMVQVEHALPDSGINVWVPGGAFQVSSLLRVPRFPNPSLKIKQVETNRPLVLQAVRNEQVSVQLAVAATDSMANLRAAVGDLKSRNGSVIKAKNVQVRFVKYVPVERALTGNTYEQVAGSKGLRGVSGYGGPDVVGDPLIHLDKVDVPMLRAQPIWFTLHVPKQSRPGEYRGQIEIQTDQYAPIRISVRLTVNDYTIPDPKDYSFNSDIWMDPFSIADYYDVKPWSEAHWELLKAYFQDLAFIGQKKIMTPIIEHPWKIPWLHGQYRSQTESGYHSMIKWRLLKNGQWDFDYSIFDKYVETALENGNGPSISAYSMLTFRGPQRLTYFDEQKEKEVVEQLKVRDERYKDVWSIFLKDFSTHLKQKGWLDQTYLGFDERPAELMKRLLAIIRDAAPEFEDKMYVSGTSKVEMFKYAADLNLGYDFLPGGKRSNLRMDQAIERRIKEGRSVRFYQTCCSSSHPNRYSYSPAVESYLIGWIPLKYDLNGYADWAYNSWPKDVFNYPVFNYPQGDEYFVYPGKNGPISSIRWELLKEGIEDFELVQTLQKSGELNKKNETKVIELVTRNPDGRLKDLQDIIKARQILLSQK